MLALMETPDKPYYAHPLFWAPFVIVATSADDLTFHQGNGLYLYFKFG